MPDQLLNILPQLGPTTIVSIVALYFFYQLIKNRKNNKNGGNGETIKLIKDLKNNHFEGFDTKLSDLKYVARQSEKKLDTIISLLTRIDEKLRR